MFTLAKLAAGAALVAGSFGVAAPSGAAPAAPSDFVSSQETLNVCLYIEKIVETQGADGVGPSGNAFYVYQARTVHLFGGPIHVTQCALRDIRLNWSFYCYQLAWNMPAGQTSPGIELYARNFGDGTSTPCW